MYQTVMNFLANKGVSIDNLNDNSILMQYIQSADFMELIVTIEIERGSELDLESADIEQISSLGGFVRWIESH